MSIEEILSILRELVDEDGRDHDVYMRLRFSQRLAIRKAMDRLQEQQQAHGEGGE